MEVLRDTSSDWIGNFERQLLRGNHVLLHGNVHDMYLANGEFLPLVELRPTFTLGDGFLGRYFVGKGYRVVAFWDMVDGLRFPDPAMRPCFRSLGVQRPPGHAPDGRAVQSTRPEVRSGSTSRRVSSDSIEQPATSSHQSLGDPPDDRNGRQLPFDRVRQIEDGRQDSRGGGPARPDGDHGPGDHQWLDARYALDEFRQRVQTETPIAVVLTFSDRLFSDASRQDHSERQLLIQLQKTMQEAAQLDSEMDHALVGRRNALVLIAERLEAVPEWLYRDNPHLKLVHVGKPDRDERLTFVHTYKDAFFTEASLDERSRESVFRQFADVTEGLRISDLDKVAMTSHAERMPLNDPKKLVNFYRFGQKKDPWSDLDYEKVQSAREALASKVYGQHAAVTKMVALLVSARVGLSMTEEGPQGGKPKGTFFFVGPTGVGKTQLAKELAELIFGDQNAYARFDMSEFAQEHSAERLTGSPPGYVGYEQGGQLTNRMLEQPFSVLLFDEIEKAHGKVLDKFLQILEDGRLTDSKGQTAYFDQSVIIFTSNIGSDCLTRDGQKLAVTDSEPSYEWIAQQYRQAVKEHFERDLKRPELLNRLGEENIVVFDVLRPSVVHQICGKFQDALRRSARQTHGVDVQFDKSVSELTQRQMSRGDNLLYGGRRIRRLLEEHVQAPLSHWLFRHGAGRGSQVTVTADLEQGEIVIDGRY